MKVKTRTVLLIAGALLIIIAIAIPSCKSCKKDKPEISTPADTSATVVNPNVKTIDAPHGDTALIPVLAGILNKGFEAAQKKDYETLGALIVYRGPDDKRHGEDVFRVKNNYEKNVVRLTADVFSKWTTGAESIDYSRVFEMQQPDGRTLEVLEVIIVYPKKIDRKFFGFLLINNEYKIADVTSYL